MWRRTLHSSSHPPPSPASPAPLARPSPAPPYRRPHRRPSRVVAIAAATRRRRHSLPAAGIASTTNSIAGISSRYPLAVSGTAEHGAAETCDPPLVGSSARQGAFALTRLPRRLWGGHLEGFRLRRRLRYRRRQDGGVHHGAPLQGSHVRAVMSSRGCGSFRRVYS